MKVFISWSGERSQALAAALKEWLPMVLHYVEPFVSESDIEAGERWAQKIGNELEAANFGIICITPENLNSPWVLFEAGALSKSMQDGRVIPLLYGLEYSDITDPLAQFQAKKADERGLKEVIQAISQVSEQETPEERTKKLFAALWSDFEEKLSDIPDSPPSKKHVRPNAEILEELVTGVRGLDSRVRDFEMEITDGGRRRYSKRKFRRFHPGMFEEIQEMASIDDDPISLLIIAGFLREDFPWLAEVLVEAYREIKNGSPMEVEKTVMKLDKLVRGMRHTPFFDERMMESKETHMLVMELPMLVDMSLQRYKNRMPTKVARKKSTKKSNTDGNS